jgi:hypothetical protein
MQKSKPTQKIFVPLALILGLTMTLFSCKKDKDNEPGPGPGPSTAQIAEFRTGDEYVKFNYNGDGTVKEVIINSELNTQGNETRYDLTYTGDKKIAALSDGAGTQIIPEYENGKMVRANIMDGAERIAFTNYQYTNGNLSNATVYAADDDDFTMALAFEFNFNAAGNVTETAAFIPNGIPDHLERAGHINYQYDNHTNPLYAQRDILALFWQAVSKNNVTLENHFDADGVAEDRYQYTYTYNSKGLPQIGQVIIGLPNTTPTLMSVNFTYK